MEYDLVIYVQIRTNRAKAPNDSAVINCQYSMATFSRSERKRRPRDNKSAELTLHLKQAMATAIKTDLYPKSQIDIFVQVIVKNLLRLISKYKLSQVNVLHYATNKYYYYL